MAVFWMVSGIGIFLILLALVALIHWIPTWGPKGHINTEFLSTRAAMWCVAVGFILLVLAAVEVSVKETLRYWPCSTSVIQENVNVSR